MKYTTKKRFREWKQNHVRELSDEAAATLTLAEEVAELRETLEE